MQNLDSNTTSSGTYWNLKLKYNVFWTFYFSIAFFRDFYFLYRYNAMIYLASFNDVHILVPTDADRVINLKVRPNKTQMWNNHWINIFLPPIAIVHFYIILYILYNILYRWESAFYPHLCSIYSGRRKSISREKFISFFRRRRFFTLTLIYLSFFLNILKI